MAYLKFLREQAGDSARKYIAWCLMDSDPLARGSSLQEKVADRTL